ncbi:MAG: MarR family winged helix-turn-helix transcriptional regulator [Actinomycetes bacterium]
MTSNLDPDARTSYRLITVAARLIQRRQDDALAPLGLTRAAVIALEGLMGGPLNQEQLAEAIRVQSQTLGRVLTRLEASGLITRTRDVSDRRQMKVELTDAGVASVESARQAEVRAYPDDPEIAWDVLREELTKFVRTTSPSLDRGTGVVPFAPPEHRAGHTHRPQAGRAGGGRGWEQPRQG